MRRLSERLPENAIVVYDTGGTTDVWKVAGVDSDVDAAGNGIIAARFTERTPVSGTDQALKLVINENGEAEFFLNGEMVNTGSNVSGWKHDMLLDNAVSPDVNLCPTVLIETRSAAAVTAYVDFLYVMKGRNP